MIVRSVLGNASIVNILTDDTVTWTTLSTFDETRYYLCSTLHQSPKVRSVVVNTFTDGVHHVSDSAKKVSLKKSTDFGATFGSKTTFYDPIDGAFQAQDLAVGYSNNGRLHALIGCHDSIGTPGGNHELRYVYSDDDGATMSSPATVTLPSTSLNAWRMHDKIIDLGNGVMVAPCYFLTDEGDFTQSERYIVKTTDGGANWSFILVEGPTSAYINEGSILAVTNNIIIMMCRYEDIDQYWMYKSTDQGATWSSLGVFGTTVSLSIVGPCALRKFRSDTGKMYCVMYFPDKATARLYAIYGRLDNGVDGGLGLFNINTLTLLFDDTSILHYGDFCHYNNNMNARGVWPRENGTFPTDNEMIYVRGVATQYDTVALLIDPITIWDKLGAISFIATSRLMASNTDNSYGTVDSSDRITTVKSIRPGPISQDFTATAGGILLVSGGMSFDGTKALSHSTSTYWNFMSYSSLGEADVNYTVYLVVQFGTTANPNAAYGALGNLGASAGNKGVSILYDDRVSVPRSDAIRLMVGRGAAGLILDFVNDNVITPNALHVVCIEVDLSQATQNNKVKLYIDNNTISTTVTTYNTGVVANPTFNMQIGSTGNNVLPFVGVIKDIAIQNCIDTVAVRTNFTQALMSANGI